MSPKVNDLYLYTQDGFVLKGFYGHSMTSQKFVLLWMYLIQRTPNENKRLVMKYETMLTMMNSISKSGSNREALDNFIRKEAISSYWTLEKEDNMNNFSHNNWLQSLTSYIDPITQERYVDFSFTEGAYTISQIMEKNYTVLKLSDQLQFKKLYSLHLYQYFKMKNRYNKDEFLEMTFTITALKELLNASMKYKRTPNFMEVILPALDEINFLTDLNVSYQVIKDVNKKTMPISEINICISKKESHVTPIFKKINNFENILDRMMEDTKTDLTQLKIMNKEEEV